jgi:hypothetical protein
MYSRPVHRFSTILDTMKYLFSAITLCLMASSGFGQGIGGAGGIGGVGGIGGGLNASLPASLVRAQNANCAATSCGVTLTGVTTGDALWYCSSNTSTSSVPGAVTDGGDTFTNLNGSGTAGTSVKGKCAYVLSTTLSGSVTLNLTWGTGNNATTAIAGEVTHQTGIDGTAVFQTNGASGSTTWALPTTYTTAHANALVVGFAAGAATTSSIAACSSCGGFTIPSNGSELTAPPAAVETVGSVANGTNFTSGSFTSGTSTTTVSGIFAFY